MSTIKERILARRDLDAARAARDIDLLAAGLNEECVEALIPAQINAAAILAYAPHSEVITDLLQRAANGESVQERAQQLLSEAGVQVFDPGFDPPMVDRFQVNDAMFNPDGSEK